MRRVIVVVLAMVALASCGVDPTGDRPGEWRTVTSPRGAVYECYVVSGYRSVTMDCFPTGG